MVEKKFDIVAFEVPKHKSLLYRRRLKLTELLDAVVAAADLGANVMSIRLVED